MCNYLFKILLSILLDIYPEVDLLDDRGILWLIFWGTAVAFFIALTLFYILPLRGYIFSISSLTHVISFFFIVALLMGMRIFMNFKFLSLLCDSFLTCEMWPTLQNSIKILRDNILCMCVSAVALGDLVCLLWRKAPVVVVLSCFKLYI